MAISSARPARKPFYRQLYIQVLFAILIGVLVGIFAPDIAQNPWVKAMGDGFMTSFGSASRALDAAIAMQRAITDHFEETETPIRIRVGINAGEPIEDQDDLCGTAVI